MEDILVPFIVFGSGTLVFLAFSPVGKAIAERIRGHRAMIQETDPNLLAEIDQLRQELSDVQERLDFTERLLASQRDPAKLGAAPEERAS
jgi:hypothetical protein